MKLPPESGVLSVGVFGIEPIILRGRYKTNFSDFYLMK
jgi:hypothetical protein